MSALDQLLHQIANPSEIAWNEETYDLGLAGALSGADRATAVAKLIDNARVGDTRAILTLGHLQAVEALPMLQADGKSQEPWALAARRALVLLGHGPEVVQQIADDAVHARTKMARVAAVMDLPKIGGPVAISALEQALADEDDAVRMLPWQGLLQVFDLARLVRGPDGQPGLTTHFELLEVLVASDLPAFVRMGVAETRQLIDRLKAGATPQSLGIAWIPNPAPEVFQRIRMALFDLDAAYPVDEIAQLTGSARQWAEAMIAFRLAKQDPRVPEAMARLGAAWTVPALEEAAASAATAPELREQLTRAVRALRAS